MDSIRVGIRVRPLLDRENNGLKWRIQGGNAIVPTTPGTTGFEFDHVFGEDSTTDQIYSTITRPIVHSVMEGFNGTVFAYGQTSSGKTFTMMGTEQQPGVIPMAIQEIFDYMEDHDGSEYIVRVSYLEIYKEGICDLLDPSCGELKIREDHKNHVHVIGLKEYVVTDIEEVTRVIFVGNINRTTGETKMNERSSRSHAVLSVTVESRIKDGDGTVKVASLNLVDLAGSERLNATGAAGKRAQEGIAINKSLFTLKQVISKLSEGNTSVHIPYRDSKLTHILKPSLGGNAKTAIICAITPAETYETELTLNFAICAMKVKNRPMVNEVLGGEEALRKKLNQLEKENGELRCKLSMSESEEMTRELKIEIEEKENRHSELEARIHSLEEIIISTNKSHHHQVTTSSNSNGRDTVRDHTTGGKARRMTICPATLARDMGSPLILRLPSNKLPRHSITPVCTPEVEQRSISHTRRGGRGIHFKSPNITTNSETFHLHFDPTSFEREMDTDMIQRTLNDDDGSNDIHPHVHVRDLEKRRTMCRLPTFVMESDTPTSHISVEDQSILTQDITTTDISTLIDAQVQTEDRMEMCAMATQTIETIVPSFPPPIPIPTTDVYTQTTSDNIERGGEKEEVREREVREREVREREVIAAASVPSSDFNSSICLCNHSHGCTLKNELVEDLQFYKDELMVGHEEVEQDLTETRYDLNQTKLELQAEREKNQALGKRLDEVSLKLKDMETASSTQEEYLTKLCQQSKMATHHHGDLEDKCSQLEQELTSVSVEREEWQREKVKMENEREHELMNYNREHDKWENERKEWERRLASWEEEREMYESEKKAMNEDFQREKNVLAEESQRLHNQLNKERDEGVKNKTKWDMEREDEKKLMGEEYKRLNDDREKMISQHEDDNIDTKEKWDSDIKSWSEERGQWCREREGWEREREAMGTETSLLKEQLQSLLSELEKLPSTKRPCSEQSTTSEEQKQVKVLMEKLKELESEREMEAQQFQNSYQQKVKELHKVQETVCYLQEQLEHLETTPTTSETISVTDIHRVEEELKQKEDKILEMEEVINSLQNQTLVLSKENDAEMAEKERQWQQEMIVLTDKVQCEMAEKEKQWQKMTMEKVETEIQKKEQVWQTEMEAALDKLQHEMIEKEQQWLGEMEAALEKVQHEMIEKEQQWQMEMEAALEKTQYESLMKEQEWQHKMKTAVDKVNGDKETYWQEMMKTALNNVKIEMEEKEREYEHNHKMIVTALHKAQSEMAEMKIKYEEEKEVTMENVQREIEIKETQWKEEMATLQEKMKSEVVESHTDLEQKLSELQTEYDILTDQLTMVYTQLKITTSNLSELEEKEEEWISEKEQLCDENKALEETILRLKAQTASLQNKLTQAQHIPPASCPVALAEAEGRIRDIQEQNKRLKAQLNTKLTFEPCQSSAGAICCDSSGTVTSAATYHLRGETMKLKDEKKRMATKIEKLKAALKETTAAYNEEMSEVERYREERNIFREKYLYLKEKHAQLVAQLDGGNVSSHNKVPEVTPNTIPPTAVPTSSKPLSSVPAKTATFQPPTLSSQRLTSQPTTQRLTSQPSTFFSQRPTTSISTNKQSTLPLHTSNSVGSAFSHTIVPKSSSYPTKPNQVENNITLTATERPGGFNTVGSSQSSNLGERLWDMSMIQTVPQPNREPNEHLQNKCPQQ